MLALCLNFAAAGLVPLDQTLVLDPQVLYLVVTLLQLDLDLVAFLFSSLELTDQNIFMDLDFLLTLFHGHFQLIFSVLKSIDLVRASIDLLSEALDLELHDIVLDEGLLLLLDDSLEITTGHLVLKLKLSNHAIKGLLLLLDLDDDSVDVPALILKLLVRSGKELEIFLSFLLVLGEGVDFLLQLGLFFLGADTLHPVDLALHLLNLEVLRVDQLLLSLLFDFQLGDVGLQVSGS